MNNANRSRRLDRAGRSIPWLAFAALIAASGCCGPSTNCSTAGCPVGSICDRGSWTCVSACPAVCAAPTPLCDAGRRQCVECLAEVDCAGLPVTAQCDPVSSRCVECVADGDCLAGMPFCSAGACVECLSAASCDDLDPCTADGCDGGGLCTRGAVDLDGDGSSPVACGGGDCDDSRAAVHPGALEVCNRLDDDCSGGIDEGCPRSIGFGAATAQAEFGGTGGPSFVDGCPAGSAIAGFGGAYDAASMIRIHTLCTALLMETDASTVPYDYRLILGTPARQPDHGGTGGIDWQEVCPSGQIVTELHGATGPNALLTVVYRIGFTCSTPALSNASGTWALTLAPGGISTEQGIVGGTAFADPCPADAAATGVHGGAGALVDRIGLYCAPLQLTLVP